MTKLIWEIIPKHAERLDLIDNAVLKRMINT
jgi:hypothetical protein